MGPLTTSAFSNDIEYLTYTGNGSGSWLRLEPFNHRYFFLNSRDFLSDPNEDQSPAHLVTNRQLRGFDCTTFPLTLFELPNSAQCQGACTPDLNPAAHSIANAIGAIDADLNKKTAAEMSAELFGRNEDGVF